MLYHAASASSPHQEPVTNQQTEGLISDSPPVPRVHEASDIIDLNGQIIPGAISINQEGFAIDDSGNVIVGVNNDPILAKWSQVVEGDGVIETVDQPPDAMPSSDKGEAKTELKAEPTTQGNLNDKSETKEIVGAGNGNKDELPLDAPDSAFQWWWLLPLLLIPLIWWWWTRSQKGREAPFKDTFDADVERRFGNSSDNGSKAQVKTKTGSANEFGDSWKSRSKSDDAKEASSNDQDESENGIGAGVAALGAAAAAAAGATVLGVFSDDDETDFENADHSNSNDSENLQEHTATDSASPVSTLAYSSGNKATYDADDQDVSDLSSELKLERQKLAALEKSLDRANNEVASLKERNDKLTNEKENLESDSKKSEQTPRELELSLIHI